MSHSAFDLTPFVHLIHRQDRHKRQELSEYTRLLMQRQSDPSCAFCGLALAVGKANATLLLPAWFGIAPTSDNAVLACRSCVTRRSQLDIIDEAFTKALPAPLSPSVLNQREAMLLQSFNHFTPHRQQVEREKVAMHLHKRYEHPRCRVFAFQTETHGFIGWRERVGNPHALSVIATLLKHSHQARLTQVNGAMVFQMESHDFLEAVWALIELNALVVQLRVDGAVRPSMETDWRHCWRYLVSSMGQLRSRKTPDGIAPRKPREPSMNPSAEYMRVRLAKQREQEAEQKRQRSKAINLREALRVRDQLDAYYLSLNGEKPDLEVTNWYEMEMYRQYNGLVKDFE